jgi:hypothetical protein
MSLVAEKHKTKIPETNQKLKGYLEGRAYPKDGWRPNLSFGGSMFDWLKSLFRKIPVPVADESRPFASTPPKSGCKQ